MKANDPMVYSTTEKVSGWRLFIKTILARSYPRIIGQQREKSWIFSPVWLSYTIVPTGTFNTTLSPSRPVQLEPSPWRPRSAVYSGLKRKWTSVL